MSKLLRLQFQDMLNYRGQEKMLAKSNFKSCSRSNLVGIHERKLVIRGLSIALQSKNLRTFNNESNLTTNAQESTTRDSVNGFMIGFEQSKIYSIAVACANVTLIASED